MYLLYRMSFGFMPAVKVKETPPFWAKSEIGEYRGKDFCIRSVLHGGAKDIRLESNVAETLCLTPSLK